MLLRNYMLIVPPIVKWNVCPWTTVLPHHAVPLTWYLFILNQHITKYDHNIWSAVFVFNMHSINCLFDIISFKYIFSWKLHKTVGAGKHRNLYENNKDFILYTCLLISWCSKCWWVDIFLRGLIFKDYFYSFFYWKLPL